MRNILEFEALYASDIRRSVETVINRAVAAPVEILVVLM